MVEKVRFFLKEELSSVEYVRGFICFKWVVLFEFYNVL